MITELPPIEVIRDFDIFMVSINSKPTIRTDVSIMFIFSKANQLKLLHCRRSSGAHILSALRHKHAFFFVWLFQLQCLTSSRRISKYFSRQFSTWHTESSASASTSAMTRINCVFFFRFIFVDARLSEMSKISLWADEHNVFQPFQR